MKNKLTRGFVLRIMYPLFMIAGSFKKDKKEDIQRFIINLNNKLVKSEGKKTKKLLLLLPHCLQINDCDIRLTHNIHNCKKCGRCEIKELIQIADKYKLELFIASGGRLARRIVKDISPEAIVAVACEADLSEGIVDMYPMPVLGIPNERPFGPCFNTQVNLERVKEAIKFFAHNSNSV